MRRLILLLILMLSAYSGFADEVIFRDDFNTSTSLDINNQYSPWEFNFNAGASSSFYGVYQDFCLIIWGITSSGTDTVKISRTFTAQPNTSYSFDSSIWNQSAVNIPMRILEDGIPILTQNITISSVENWQDYSLPEFTLPTITEPTQVTLEVQLGNESGLAFDWIELRGESLVTEGQLLISVVNNQGGAVNISDLSYTTETNVNLIATPINENWRFAGWSGSIEGKGVTSNTNITLNGDMNVTANFSRNYFISDSSGNDSNDGSFQNPWQSINKLSTHSFLSGEQILFNRGEVYSGSESFTIQGTPTLPIIINAYGSGDKPHFIGSNSDQAVFRMVDCKGIEIRDLHFSSFYPSDVIAERYAIDISTSLGAGDLEYVHFYNVDFSNIKGGSGTDHMSCGIYGLIPDENDAYQNTRWNDLLVDGCTFSNVDGVATFIKDQCNNISDVNVRGSLNYYPTEKFVFQNNYGTNCYRNLLRINGCKGAIAQFNTMDTTVVGSGIWPFASEDTLVQYNLFMHTRNPNADSFVCHFDYNCEGTLMQYNIGYDVDGGLVELICASQYASSFQTDAVARYNLGIDVGFRNTENAAGILISGNVDGGKVYNNTIITYNKPQYKGISFKNWGGAWPSNNIIYNNVFYSLGTQATYHDQVRGLERGNVVTHNMYAGNISPPVAWNGQQVDQNPIIGDPKFINPYAPDFINALSSNPDWEEVVKYLSKKFKVGYNSDAINQGIKYVNHPILDLYSNSVSSVVSPTLGYHEYTSDILVDSDLDKMPDTWELQYAVILDPDNPADKWQDSDGDGATNLEEFAFLGDPTNNENIGYIGKYNFEINGNDVQVTQIRPLRSDWDDLGLIMDTYWASNLNQSVWSQAAVSVIGINSNQYAGNIHGITNNINVVEERETIFFKTIIR